MPEVGAALGAVDVVCAEVDDVVCAEVEDVVCAEVDDDDDVVCAEVDDVVPEEVNDNEEVPAEVDDEDTTVAEVYENDAVDTEQDEFAGKSESGTTHTQVHDELSNVYAEVSAANKDHAITSGPRKSETRDMASLRIDAPAMSILPHQKFKRVFK
jgi:hypothetical protein